MERNDENRGVIQFRNRAKQIINFSKLRYGNITPTDIDGSMDWARKNVVVQYEFKLKGAEMADGQRSHYRFIVDGLRRGGVKAFALLCEHDVENWQEDIDASSALVREYYKGDGIWHKIERDVVTVEQFTDWLWRTYGDQSSVVRREPRL